MSDTNAFHLFRLRPGQLFEHPEGFPTKASEIPDGPIEGWLAYAPCFDGDRSKVIGPFTPVVSRPYSDGQPAIVVQEFKHAKTEFLYSEKTTSLRPRRDDCPHWYQSGLTLRFFRVRGQS